MTSISDAKDARRQHYFWRLSGHADVERVGIALRDPQLDLLVADLEQPRLFFFGSEEDPAERGRLDDDGSDESLVLGVVRVPI